MEAIKGTRLIYLYRVAEDASTDDGTRLAFVTEDGITVSKDADATITKDGTIRTPSAAEIEKTMSVIMAQDDTMLPKLKDAMLNDKLVEVWEANLDEPVGSGTNKFSGTYYQGYITAFDVTANAEGMVEVSITIGINGKGAEGDVTVPASQQEDASYVFVDTPRA